MPLERENEVSGVENAADFSGTIWALWDFAETDLRTVRYIQLMCTQ